MGYRSDQNRREPRDGRSKRSVGAAVALGFGLLFSLGTYVLSYPPLLRVERSSPAIPGCWRTVYRPVEWLIDKTPLREPLFMWGRVWRVSRTMAFESAFRSRAFLG